ncbi:MAG TPA: hypothetical protein VGI60_15095 [Chthoniobacterales bacterium]|jgi:hypothetical protein
MESILPAVIGGGVVAIGWYVTDFLARRAETRRRIVESVIKQAEQQIEQFYGPLFNLVNQLFIYNDVKFSLLHSKRANGKLTPEQRQTVEDFFHDEYFVHLHRQLTEVLKSKLHLIEGTAMPDSVYEYLRHASQEFVQRALWKRYSISTTYLEGMEFPDNLEDDIRRDFEKVMNRYEDSIKSLRGAV